MAPKYLHKPSGRYFTISGDGRYWIFEDGERVLAPQAQQQRPPDTDAGRARPPAADVTGSRDDAPTSSLARLSVSDRQKAADPSAATGVSQWTLEDRQTGILSKWEIGPPQAVPDPRAPRPYNPKFVRSNGATELGEAGTRAANQGLVLRGFKDYHRSSDPEKDFIRFRVVEILFIPPPTSTTSTFSAITGGTPQPNSNNEFVTRMRRFVILGPGARRSFEALPIKTYNGRGCGAASVVKSHHTIIHTSDRVPKPMKTELPQRLSNNRLESGMRQKPIKVRVYDKETALDEKSRLDFFDLYEFDYNHYIKLFGTVHEDSRPDLIPLFNAVRADLQLSTYQTAPPPARTVPSNTQVTPQPAIPMEESSAAALEAGIKKVTENLQRFRAYARQHGYTEPTITRPEVLQYARDEDAFTRWVLSVKEDFQEEEDDTENETDEEGDDNND